jgi:hypothetical protein
MFAEPTLDDFTRRLDWHVAQAKTECANAIKAIARKFNAAGRRGSGSCATSILSAIEASLDKAADTILGELKRALDTTELERTALREKADGALWSFLFEAKALFRPHQVVNVDAITQRIRLLDDRLRFLLRQFDVGFSQPRSPAAPPTLANSISIGVMSNSTLQQGAGNSISNATMTINISAARDAIVSLETTLAGSDISSATREEIQGDLDTIKAQLAKCEPSRSIVAEAAKSLRNIFEDVVAGALTPKEIAAAAALWTALGMGAA